ncbi:hypothetical protein J4408_03320 [Candidatus Pacearchaeota archaeon]|nr:hypothetical protein [Candidatus Pacearchaeota archaeon]
MKKSILSGLVIASSVAFASLEAKANQNITEPVQQNNVNSIQSESYQESKSSKYIDHLAVLAGIYIGLSVKDLKPVKKVRGYIYSPFKKVAKHIIYCAREAAIQVYLEEANKKRSKI